ncbi:RecB family exonuclease [Tomitella biformata]|uniref:RecB family exonuclease n=1 Tax=Tomitella biformata TaxID=630403 RepID=UPI0004B9288F|nr:RecB family exonuclease [Tomitella biformata]
MSPIDSSDPTIARGRRSLALSPSRASDFRQCPLLYRFRAVDRIPETPSVAQVRGTLVHSVLEELYGLDAPERERARAEAMVGPAWAAMAAADPTLDALVGDGERAGFLSDAMALVANYYTMEDPTRFEPESCELRVEAVLPDGTKLRGFVDRIDIAPTGQMRVVDYKTGKSPHERYQAQALFQMKFYALLIFRTRGVIPDQLKLMYLADAQNLTLAPQEEELLSFERTLSAIWQTILAAGVTGDFQPTPSKLCDWCDHKQRCPSFGGTPPPYPGWPE